jgi:hypothetical protein
MTEITARLLGADSLPELLSVSFDTFEAIRLIALASDIVQRQCARLRRVRGRRLSSTPQPGLQATGAAFTFSLKTKARLPVSGIRSRTPGPRHPFRRTP